MRNEAQRRKAQLKRQKCSLFAFQEGRCYYCQQFMTLSFAPPEPHKSPDPRSATIEHLDHRFSPERGQHGGEYRKVLSCRKCNDERGRLIQASQPIEVLRERAGRHPQDVHGDSSVKPAP
jgi:hypothetical protein